MMLKPDDFPLRALGTSIYARNWSSPVLTAADPVIADQVTGMLNRCAGLPVPPAPRDPLPLPRFAPLVTTVKG